MSWLNEITKAHAEFESPKSFYQWAALAAISAVVKDNIWIDRYLHKLYPNVYVMLHAESGMKKGPPVSMAKQLVTHSIGSKGIISGRSSIQGILQELGRAQTVPGGTVEYNSATFICSSELSSSIIDDPIATTILTDLYDRQYNEGNWKSLLKTDQFQIKNPTITMLSATNEAMSEDFFAKSAIKGGYFARTFIIHESKRNRTNSLLVPPENKINYIEAAVYLKSLASLRGPFKALGSRTHTEDHKYSLKDSSTGNTFYYTAAGIVYEEWYNEFTQLTDAQEVKDDTGTLNRFGDSVLKVAMLVSLAKNGILEISDDTMREAITICEKLAGNVRKATMGKNGTNLSAALKSMIIMELINRDPHLITKDLLMRKLMYHYSGENEFADMMVSLHSAGAIMTKNIGQKIVYEMPKEEAEKYKNLISGKMMRGKM